MSTLLPQPLQPIVLHTAFTSPSVAISSRGGGGGVAMEGKSLFTCHQCGALLKFKFNPVSIQEKIMRLRPVEFEQLHTETNEENVTLVPQQATDGTIQTPAVVPELVWENQCVGPDSLWRPVELELKSGISPYYSCNRGSMGQEISDVIPARFLNKPHLWLSDWEIDHTVERSDDEGWVYAASFTEFQDENAKTMINVAVTTRGDGMPQECVVRRRRLVRKRQIDGSDLSWFQELLDCSSLLLQKKTPSCHDCEVVIIHNLTQTLDSLTVDRQQYESFLAQYIGDGFPEEGQSQTHKDNYEEEWADDPELRALQEEERRLLEELEALEAETNQVTLKRRDLWSSGTDLEHLIRGTFAEGAFLQHLLGLSRDERQSVGVCSVHASDMLRRLQRYNVCNDVFHIWHVGLFGTINGLRLGRLPSKPVEWVEINAALGQAVLLLATIAERANLTFTRNRLIPRGSFSRVVNMYGKEYSLYSDGGMFRRRGFNQAMILFLECVDDAGRRAMKEEPSLKFPYKIQRGKIGDLPISLGNDEQWTKALKYMLTHLKWLLAWISKRYT